MYKPKTLWSGPYIGCSRGPAEAAPATIQGEKESKVKMLPAVPNTASVLRAFSGQLADGKTVVNMTKHSDMMLAAAKTALDLNRLS
jgi:hypothetical protein